MDAAGGRYVDVAVMAPVHPRLHRTPLLISGPHAEDAAPVLAALDMAAEIHDGPVGSSSAIKMIRSIMMKGLEALVCECVLAGRKAGVIETVLEFARRHLSRLRLEEALGLHARAGDDAWRPARRRNARGRADGRSPRPRRRHVARLCRLAADDRRPRPAIAAAEMADYRILADRDSRAPRSRRAVDGALPLPFGAANVAPQRRNSHIAKCEREDTDDFQNAGLARRAGRRTVRRPGAARTTTPSRSA